MSKLIIPENVLDQHLVVLGKTGAGKSSALRHIVEHLLTRDKRVCIIDPKGDWWGLKASADGKSAGFPVIMFGDFKEAKAQDVPINKLSGPHVADLIATGNRPAVVGLRGWHTADMHSFWEGFASTLFAKNIGELYVVGDEFHNFAPKGKVLSPQAGISLHWSNRLLSEGRGLGLVCLIASQRPQKVHNDTLTSCETLVAMRVVHAADRNAVKDWIDGAGNPEKGKEVLASLASLDRGEGWVWSPEAGFGPKRVKFPMFTTFDSFAPPQLQKKVTTAGWADVNLDQVKEKLAAVIQEAKANDPAYLKKEIAELKRQLASRPTETREVVKEKIVEVPVLKNGQLDRTEKHVARLEAIAEKVFAESAELRRLIAPAAAPRPTPTPTRQAVAIAARPAVAPRRQPAATSGPGESLPKAERRILAALAQYPDGRTIKQVAVLTGYAMNGGGFRNALGALRSKSYIADVPGLIAITDAGAAVLGDYEPLPHGDALLQHWYGQLGKAEREILEVLAAAHPDQLSIEEVAQRTPSQYAPGGGGFRNALGRLRTLELVEGRSEVKASDELFG